VVCSTSVLLDVLLLPVLLLSKGLSKAGPLLIENVSVQPRPGHTGLILARETIFFYFLALSIY
jgi:hypothetical protein